MISKLLLLTILSVFMVHFIFGGTLPEVQKAPRGKLGNKPRPENDPCIQGVPCAWAVYIRPGREVDYIIHNCRCINNTICTKDEDDLSITAFVYRCRPNNSTTTVSPSEATSKTVTAK